MKRFQPSGALVGLTLLLLARCIPDDTLKIEFNWEPADIGDGWVTSAPEDQGFSSPALRDAYELFFSERHYVTAISLLVVRHGTLLAEGYCRDLDDRYLTEHTQSVTKSYTSIIFGIVRGDGYFEDLDAPLYDYIPDSFDDDPRKRDITLRHLLTMTSGILFDNDDFAMDLAIDDPADPMAYILAKPMYNQPGQEFYYRDADPHLLGGAVRAATGQTLEEIARERLFEPMGISEWIWEEDSGGNSFGPYGLFARPRDLAKFGQLLLNEGAWNGQQLVPVEWVREATSFQIEPDQGNPNTAAFDYGFYWWIVPELNAFTASGAGGNFVFVVPAHDLVIVFTAEPDADDDSVGTVLGEFVPLAQMIISAIQQ